MGQAKAPAYQPAVPEDLSELVRGGIGNNVKILGLSSEKQVAHTSARKVAEESALGQRVENLECLRADILPAQSMFMPRDGSRQIHGQDVTRCALLVNAMNPWNLNNAHPTGKSVDWITA